MVHFSLTLQAVVFLTSGTPIVIQDLVKGKDSRATWRRTPGRIRYILIHIVLKSELIIFLQRLALQFLLNVLCGNHLATFLIGTLDGQILFLDLELGVFAEALFVKRVAAG